MKRYDIEFIDKDDIAFYNIYICDDIKEATDYIKDIMSRNKSIKSGRVVKIDGIEIEIDNKHLTCKEFISNNHDRLRKLYFLINAYWCDTKEVKDGTIDLSKTIDNFCIELYNDYKENVEEEIEDAIKYYINKLYLEEG